MTSVRRRLRLWTAAWLAFQALSLAALVPRDCCATRETTTASAEPDCHTTAKPAATHCPMRGADGAPCPMHQGTVAEESVPADCALTGTCGDQHAALGALLWQQGVLVEALASQSPLEPGAAASSHRSHRQTRFSPPDPPPPRPARS